MSITRKNLREKLGEEVQDSVISELLNMIHAEVDGIRDERDEALNQVNTIKAELETEKVAREKAEKDFGTFKDEQKNKETRNAKETAYKELLIRAGVGEKGIKWVIPTTDFDSIELDKDGNIKDSDKLIEKIKTDCADFIPVVSTNGADVENPPHNTNTSVTKEQFNKMGYSARVDLYNKDPDTYRELSKEN